MEIIQPSRFGSIFTQTNENKQSKNQIEVSSQEARIKKLLNI